MYAIDAVFVTFVNYLNHVLKKHPLWVLVSLGFGLRVSLVLFSKQIYYPDEVFQSLEQAYRLTTGVGIIPWDFDFQIRSYVLPILISLPLRLLLLLHMFKPQYYVPILQILLSLASLLLIPAAYKLVCWIQPSQSNSKQIALTSAFGVAIWYELVYFSFRYLSEVVAVILLAGCFLLLPRLKEHITRKYYFFWGMLLTFAILIRPQFFPLGLAFAAYFGWYWYLQPRLSIQMLGIWLLGCAVSIGLFGVLDYYYYHGFLSHLVANVHISLQAGISELFGTKPWWYYIVSLFFTTGGLFLLGFRLLTSKRALLVALPFGLILLIHSILPHKEYRFVLPLVFLSIVYGSIGLIKLLHQLRITHAYRMAMLLLVGLSLMGLGHRLPYQSLAYPQKMTDTTGRLESYFFLSQQSELCGLFDKASYWVDTGGYFYLGQKVPLYTIDYRPSSTSYFNYWLTMEPQLPDVNYQPIAKFKLNEGPQSISRNYLFLYKREGLCQTDNNYSLHRSFEYIDSVLPPPPK